MASAENQNTSMAPNSPPTNTSGFEISTAASGDPSAATSSRYAENSRNAARAAEPIAYPLVSDRLGGPRRVPAVLGVSRRGRGARVAARRRRYLEARGVRGRTVRRHARVLVLGACHQR